MFKKIVFLKGIKLKNILKFGMFAIFIQSSVFALDEIPNIDHFSAYQKKDAQQISNQFRFGNELVFKGTFPFLMLFKEKGFSAFKKMQYHLEILYPESYVYILKSFNQQEILEKKLLKFSKLKNLDKNDPRLLNEFFLDPINKKMAYEASLNLQHFEHKIVQEMYTQQFIAAFSKTENKNIRDLYTQNVKGVTFSFSDYIKEPDVSDQRVRYLRSVFSEY
jgi:hypothetical protein